MRFEEWEPAYEGLLSAFGYDRAADERARDRLAAQTGPFDLSTLDATGDHVAVAAPGPPLPDELDRAAAADQTYAASAAAETLCEAGVTVDCVVTDLDGTPATAVDLAEDGTPVAVHAHGDNVAALDRWVPEFPDDRVLPTTQAAPAGPVVNCGGFTDGDRAAFLADAVGAASLTFPGWDLDDRSGGGEKHRKLTWAARLLHWLERRRDEQFGLLDGRRGDLQLPWLERS